HLKRKKASLNIRSPTHQRSSPRARHSKQHLKQPITVTALQQMRIQIGTQLIQRITKNIKRPIKLATHPQTLRTLTRKQKPNLRTSHSHPLHNIAAPPPLSKHSQTIQQLPTIPPNNHPTMTQPSPTHRKRIRHIQRIKPPRLHTNKQPPSLLTQRTRRLPRNHQRHNRNTTHNPINNLSPRPRRPNTNRQLHRHHSQLHRRLLPNHMRIRPTNPKRRHRRTTWLPLPWPRHRVREQSHAA